jgi:hypothetical protein
MIPVGYMAKRIPKERPDWLQAPEVIDVYSVSDCVNESLAEYANGWKHNGFWMFDSPADIKTTAIANQIDLHGSALFFYEAYEAEFDGPDRLPVVPDAMFETQVLVPHTKHLEGFDVVTSCDGPNSHSPLSCNSIAADLKTNQHCLFASLDEAVAAVENGAFDKGEPGPYRIYSVSSMTWPE